ncbi:MAG: hypothetical protein HC942_26875 [Microcoleus sp. SU_5_6]|nr:hypothetical protein [Microcoleus sp. SU_5_6]
MTTRSIELYGISQFLMLKSHSVLFLSNGHGEDTINCQILKALKAACPNIDVSADLW